MAKLYIYNTLTRRKEELKPLGSEVGIYTCGPTVYDYAHIGNFRTYVFEDILIRTLRYLGYKVKHVMNITDVGHLTTDDEFSGEDKMLVAARRERKSPWEIAEYYTEAFKRDMRSLNISEPTILAPATEHIQDMIEFIKRIERNGYAYMISLGLFLDTSKIPNYGILARLDLSKLKPGARLPVHPEKRNPWDFALWLKAPPEHIMQWDSPWGRGYPGWHIECSAISTKYLGEVFDIHCGGVDHIPVHHTNEIAQSQAAYGKIPANYWMHGEFLVIGERRMGKSEGNIYTVEDLRKMGFTPLALRYFYFTAHYRTKLNFTLEALRGAQNALEKIYQHLRELPEPTGMPERYLNKFKQALCDDLNMPRVLAIVWEVIKDDSLSGGEKRALLEEFDKVLGLDFVSQKRVEIPDWVRELLTKREQLRRERRYAEADAIRERLRKEGWEVQDTPHGPRVRYVKVT